LGQTDDRLRNVPGVYAAAVITSSDWRGS